MQGDSKSTLFQIMWRQKGLPKPVLTHIYVAIGCYYATHNELIYL